MGTTLPSHVSTRHGSPVSVVPVIQVDESGNYAGGAGGGGGDASAAKQDLQTTELQAVNTKLTTIDGRVDGLETLIASTNTKLDTLHTDAVTALPAGANEIGKVNERHINVAGATLTRAANTTAYAALDSISDNATAGSVTALSSNNLSDVNDDPITLSEILLDTTDTGPGTAAASIRIHLFNSDPTASSGVVGGDNIAYSNKRAGWFGSFSGTMRLFSDGSKGVLVADEGSLRIAFVASGAKNIWWQLQTLTAFTPSANSTTFTPRFKGFQGRT